MLLLAASAAGAQPGGGAYSCNVVVGRPDLNEAGEFVRPPVRPEDCGAVEDLIEAVLDTDRRDFRRSVSAEGVPGPVRVYVGRITRTDDFWRPRPVTDGDAPGARHVVTWLSDEIAIVVYEVAEFAGAVLNVVITDLKNQQVCTYSPWPTDNNDPRRLGIEDVQEILADVRRGRRSTPVCRLESLVAE